jgi:uncharacterized protein YdhG (YjbR/CyaY superfamily)
MYHSATMRKTGFKSVDDYIASHSDAVQDLLARVRGAVRKALPGAEETISYQIPTYKLHGRPVLYFAAFKQHYSIYPSNERLVAAFKKDLSPYEVEKGTIRFPLTEPVPVKLIAAIAKFRAQEVTAQEKAKKAGSRTRHRRDG